MEKLAEASARIIAAQPREVQEALTQHIAGFLAAQPEVTQKAEEIADLLHKKLQSVAMSSPEGWLGKVSTAAAFQQSPSL